jgi:RimJ/RimL family protein N-acetyltransferase
VVSTRLRPPRPQEQEVLARWEREPASPFEDFSGPPPPGVDPAARAPATDGRGALAVTDADDRLLGSVSWHAVLHGPSPGSAAIDVGISLRPEARGAGHGTRAQRLLAEYLFATTPVHRVQASTDVENVAEQRALERAGFRREGVLRGAQWRAGAYHDLVAFARLRTDD